MAKLSYSKAALHKQSAQLKRYQKYLPSLDLKRQQILAELNKAGMQMRTTQQLIADCQDKVATQLPMLSTQHMNLQGLVSVQKVEIVTENVVGIQLPNLRHIELVVQPYSLLSKPHWVDMLVQQLFVMLRLQLQQQIELKRVQLLQQALKKVTQRVNLFDKVLIPRTRQQIKKISIFLSDSERAAVVRAKMTKQKRLQEVV